MAANTLFSIHGITGQVFRGTLERGQSGVPILDERGAPAGFVSRTDILCGHRSAAESVGVTRIAECAKC